MSNARAGRIRGPIDRWPVTERPTVWVTVEGTRLAGLEHARAEGGSARLVAWGANYKWVNESDVSPRE